MAGLIALLGSCVNPVCSSFSYSERLYLLVKCTYQKLWLGRMTVVFAVCCFAFSFA